MTGRVGVILVDETNVTAYHQANCHPDIVVTDWFTIYASHRLTDVTNCTRTYNDFNSFKLYYTSIRKF